MKIWQVSQYKHLQNIYFHAMQWKAVSTDWHRKTSKVSESSPKANVVVVFPVHAFPKEKSFQNLTLPISHGPVWDRCHVLLWHILGCTVWKHTLMNSNVLVPLEDQVYLSIFMDTHPERFSDTYLAVTEEMQRKEWSINNLQLMKNRDTSLLQI